MYQILSMMVDVQIDVTFSYEQIVKDIYRDNFDFLMIRKKIQSGK